MSSVRLYTFDTVSTTYYNTASCLATCSLAAPIPPDSGTPFCVFLCLIGDGSRSRLFSSFVGHRDSKPQGWGWQWSELHELFRWRWGCSSAAAACSVLTSHRNVARTPGVEHQYPFHSESVPQPREALEVDVYGQG